jgi:hypothetical protein
LIRELGLGGGALDQLTRITARGELVKINNEQWSLPRTTPEKTARASAPTSSSAGRRSIVPPATVLSPTSRWVHRSTVGAAVGMGEAEAVALEIEPAFLQKGAGGSSCCDMGG